MSELPHSLNWAYNASLDSALKRLIKSGAGDNCCDASGCCLYFGDIAAFNAPNATELTRNLTFAEAAELERKAGMFEDIARTIRETLVRFPPR